MSDFDWATVHDFDVSEAGRTPEEIEALIAGGEATNVLDDRDTDIPEMPEHLRDR